MSIEIIKEQIQEFLSSNIPQVLAIKGAWGVGKTYSWNKMLISAQSKNKISLNKYSYVSLFGVNSLDSFKYAIFENVINKEIIGTEANIETFKKNTTGLMENLGRKSLGFLKGAPLFDGFSPAIESLSFLSLSNTIICIDDLERRGESLSVKDVLGLISQLKEQKKCKIALLLNDKEEGLDDYLKYKEKVVDIELKFEPTAKESADIAFDSDIESMKKSSELTQKLNIVNIRILKKIERLVNLILPLAKDYEAEISDQILHSLVLFSWCYYCSSDEVPPLDFVTNIGYDILLGLEDDQKTDEGNKKWKNIIGDYGFQYADELDTILSEAVKTGYINKEEFTTTASLKNTRILAGKSEGEFSKTWQLYHNSFDDNKNEVIQGLYENFKKNAKNITPTNLNGTVRLFRELGEEIKASEIIDHYISERKDEKELFNITGINFFGDIQDKEIIDKFKVIYQASLNKESAIDVLRRIADKSGWNTKDEVILANTSVDEYYYLFKSEKGSHLSSYIRACLKFGEFTNANKQMQEISNKTIEALKRIAGENELNRLRVKKFGIDLKA